MYCKVLSLISFPETVCTVSFEGSFFLLQIHEINELKAPVSLYRCVVYIWRESLFLSNKYYDVMRDASSNMNPDTRRIQSKAAKATYKW